MRLLLFQIHRLPGGHLQTSRATTGRGSEVGQAAVTWPAVIRANHREIPPGGAPVPATHRWPQVQGEGCALQAMGCDSWNNRDCHLLTCKCPLTFQVKSHHDYHDAMQSAERWLLNKSSLIMMASSQVWLVFESGFSVTQGRLRHFELSRLSDLLTFKVAFVMSQTNKLMLYKICFASLLLYFQCYAWSCHCSVWSSDV